MNPTADARIDRNEPGAHTLSQSVFSTASDLRGPRHELRTWKVSASILAAVAIASLSGCAVGPNYKRPAVSAPQEYRRAASDTNTSIVSQSFADLGWWEMFKDPQLTAYIAEALTNNWDIRIAASRVLQAEANLSIVRSQFFPTINAGGDIFTTRVSRKGATSLPPGVNPQRNYGDVFLSMSAYEIDLWGRIRRANEAARAQLLANIDAQRAVRQTLVAEVATAYLDLLEFDLELDIARRSYDARTNSLELTRSRESGGVAGKQDVYQAEILVHTAEAAIADILRQIEQGENQFCILLGRNPGHIARGTKLTAQAMRADVPAGLPSSLLERRPDLRAAEQQLIAANADIGQAKAAFYPTLALTGLYGHQSIALSDLFTGATRTWQFGPAITMPLFTGGRLRGNLKLARARFQESLNIYQQRIQDAFREVSDALIAYQRTQEFRQKQEERTLAHRAAADMANVRYEGGVTSYLEVLYNEQELFNAELSLAQGRRNELQSVVELYRSLGGGWTDSGRQALSKN
jgi:multidrug efflux system outer membrane protein